MDLDLPARYFELLMQRMESDPRLGTTSGKPWFVHPQSGRLVPEVCGDEMSVGMTKFYRVACFKEIGGFVRQVMWDGIDCHRARMLGWIAESVDREPLRFIHLRPKGASQKGIWTGRLRAGFGQYFMGTSPLYHLAVAIYRLPAYPVLLGSVAMLWGYFRAGSGRAPLRRSRVQAIPALLPACCLRMGKRAAIAKINAERSRRQEGYCFRCNQMMQPIWRSRGKSGRRLPASCKPFVLSQPLNTDWSNIHFYCGDVMSMGERIYFLGSRFDIGSIEERCF